MSPSTGRPKSENPRDIQYRLRMTLEEVERLEYCCKVFGLTKAEVLRQGLQTMYEKAQAKK